MKPSIYYDIIYCKRLQVFSTSIHNDCANAIKTQKPSAISSIDRLLFLWYTLAIETHTTKKEEKFLNRKHKLQENKKQISKCNLKKATSELQKEKLLIRGRATKKEEKPLLG